jgi:hypothetical protein
MHRPRLIHDAHAGRSPPHDRCAVIPRFRAVEFAPSGARPCRAFAATRMDPWQPLDNSRPSAFNRRGPGDDRADGEWNEHTGYKARHAG